MKSFVQRMVLYKVVWAVFIVTVSTVVLLEITLRIWGGFATYTERVSGKYSSPYNQLTKSWYFLPHPNLEMHVNSKEFSYTTRIDSNGLIRHSFCSPRANDTFRILIMGDSFTFGVGAPGDSSWPALLADFMKHEYDSTVFFEVINASKPGSDVVFQQKIYEDILCKRLKPSLLLLALNTTDIYEVATRGGAERFKRDSTIRTLSAPWFEPFYHYSHTLRCLAKLFGGIDNEYLIHRARVDALLDSSAVTIKQSVLSIYRAAQKNNTNMMVAIFPMPKEILESNNVYDPLGRYKKFMQQ
jgi:hypothetical protein